MHASLHIHSHDLFCCYICVGFGHIFFAWPVSFKVVKASKMLSESIHRINVSDEVADLRGAQGTRAPHGGPNSFNFMQFLGKFDKFVCWRPPWGVGAPSSGKSWICHCDVEIFYPRIAVTVTAPDRCYCLKQASLTIHTRGRAGKFPVGRSQ